MHDFLCADPDEMYLPILSEKVRKLKTLEKGSKTMCRISDEIREEMREEVNLMAIQNIMDVIRCSVQRAMEILKIPMDSRTFT